MLPLLTWSFVRVLLISAVTLASVIWWPLSLRYRIRRAALGALFVILCSFTISLLFTAYIDGIRDTRTSDGEWPSVIATEALGGLCDFLSPIICLGVIFWTTTLTAITTLEIQRAIKTPQLGSNDSSEHNNITLPPDSDSDEGGTQEQ